MTIIMTDPCIPSSESALPPLPHDIGGLPIFGVLTEIRRDPPKFLRKILRKHGAVVPMKMGPHRVIMAGHPDAVKHVCVTNAQNYEKTRFVEKLKPILGNGLATSNGRVWEISRRIIQPKLTTDQVKKHIARMDEIIRESIAEWPEDEFDIAKASCRLTLKVISGTMFSNPNHDAARRIVAAIDAIQNYLSKSVWSIVPYHKLCRTATYRAFQRALDDVFVLVNEMIVVRRAGETEDDLLQALLDAVDPETGEKFSDQQIFDEVMTTFMAGHDTTGNTLSFIWNVLAGDPALQTKLRSEAMAAVSLDRSPSFEELKGLNLTLSVLKETMRLNPSSWWFARTAIADDKLMNVPVKAGDVVMVAPYVTHRLAEFWPDPETFDAYRFLRELPIHRFAYIPFGAGHRMCPGSHFATAEMMLAVARVLQARELKKKQEIEFEALITMRPKNGLAMEAPSWTGLHTVKHVRPGENAFADCILRLRKEVFIDYLGWPLKVDSEGREIDSFDNEHAEYSAVVSKGEIMAFGRLLPTEKKSLLFDVFGELIEYPDMIERGPAVWEGTRLAVHPKLTAEEAPKWFSKLIRDSALRKANEGVKYFCSVSDPIMERILKRTGITVARLGSPHRYDNGVTVVGLRLDCVSDQDKILPFLPQAAQLPTVSNTKH